MEYLNGLQSVNLIVPEGVLDTLASILGFACYVLPMGTIISIFTARMALASFKLVMAIIVRVKSFIPTMGA